MGFTRNDLKTNTGTSSTITAAATTSASSGELCCLSGWVWDDGASTTLPATFSDGTDTYTMAPSAHQQMLTNFHTFEYYAILSRGVSSYAPSFSLGTPGTSREWRVAFTHYTPTSTPSNDQDAGQVQSSSVTNTDSTSSATTDANCELAHAVMITDAVSGAVGITDPDGTSVPASGWLAGGLYRIQNNSSNQAGTAEEFNGTSLHSVAARYHSGQTTAGHQAAAVITYKLAAGAVNLPPGLGPVVEMTVGNQTAALTAMMR